MATATVTVLFTDQVGSTALMSRLGETAADALRREHFDSLRGPVGTFGGVEVKNLGDGLMVAFTSAVDAVAATVAMQQAPWRRNQRAEEALEIRVGVAVGDVEVDECGYGARSLAAIESFTEEHPGRILHVRYPELVREPGAVAEAALSWAGVPPDGALGSRIDSYLAAQQAGGRATPPADLDPDGLVDPAWVRGHPVIGRYIAQSGIEPEAVRLTGA